MASSYSAVYSSFSLCSGRRNRVTASTATTAQKPRNRQREFCYGNHWDCRNENAVGDVAVRPY